MSEHTPESKLIKTLRTILSFILSVVIATLSISICFNASFLNINNIEKRFTSYEYTVGVRDNYISYTKSIYDRNGIDIDNLNDIISYDAVKNIVDNYAGHYINTRVGFDENSYLNSIDELGNDLKADIENQIQITGQNNDGEKIEKLVTAIKDYFANEVSVNGVDKLHTVVNVGKPIIWAVFGVSIFFFVFVTLILYFLGEKRYRSMRAISISFLTAGIFEICLAGIVLIISQVKRFDIYPLYLYNQFMKYIYNSIGVVISSGLIAIFVALAIATLTWLKKVKGKG